MNENENKKGILITIIAVIIISIIGTTLFLTLKPKDNTNNTNDNINQSDATNKENDGSLKSKEMVGYSFWYPDTYDTYSISGGDTLVTDNVDIHVMFDRYGPVLDLSQDTLVQYSDDLSRSIDSVSVDGKKVRCNRQTIETYETGKTNGFDYAKTTGKLIYSIDNSECDYIAYYVLTEDSKLIYWVGVADSGYEKELASTMETIKDNFKKVD